MSEPRKLRVFLCHASQDKPAVRELYQKLLAESWIDPWLDEEKLLPGQAWSLEIEKAVETADAVIVCLSNNSVTKEGYVQKEFRKIVETALEKPEETIFVIPLRLEACELPRQLRNRQAVDYFPPERRAQSFQRLLRSLEIRFHQLEIPKSSAPIAGVEQVMVEHEIKTPAPAMAEEKPPQKGFGKRLVDLLASKGTGTVDITGSIPMILYFLLAANYILTSSDSTNQLWAGIFGILASIPLVIRKQIPATIFFRISAIAYLVLYILNFNNQTPLVKASEGIAALITCGLCIVTVRSPKKPVFYASLALALSLFLVGIKEIMSSLDYYPAFLSLPTLITIASLGTVILLLGDL